MASQNKSQDISLSTKHNQFYVPKSKLGAKLNLNISSRGGHRKQKSTYISKSHRGQKPSQRFKPTIGQFSPKTSTQHKNSAEMLLRPNEALRDSYAANYRSKDKGTKKELVDSHFNTMESAVTVYNNFAFHTKVEESPDFKPSNLRKKIRASGDQRPSKGDSNKLINSVRN